MPFGQAAWSEAFSQAYQRALASISGFTTADLILYLPFGVTGPLSSAFTIFVQTFTDQLAALRPYLQTMTGYHLQGEALSYVRSGFAGFAGAAGAELVGILFSVPQIGAQLASLGITSAIFTASTEPLVDEREISNNGLGLSPIELHSQALLTILLFGERQWGPEGGSSAWKRAFRFFGSKLIDDEIAAQSGLVRAAGNSLGTGRAASGLQIASMIAYSAINEGTLVFGDVRRQNIWHNLRRRLAECGLRLGVDVRRRACGIASADVRWSFA